MTNIQISLVNNSNKPLKIFDYKRLSRTPENIFEIAEDDDISKSFIETEGRRTIGPHDFFSGDSLLVVFGDKERFITYVCPTNSSIESCDKEGNILNLLDPRWKLERSDGFVIRFYNLTPLDFENAQPCDGNCN